VSKTLVSADAVDRDALAPRIASSAVVIGRPTLGARSLLSEGAVVRASSGAVSIGTGSAVIENSVVVGTPALPTVIGRRTTFGHRCLVVGATVGDLCEIGNASILMPGARLGDRVFLGEGTLEPGAIVCDGSVVGAGCVVRAGAVVKQRSRFGDGLEIDGFPAAEVAPIDPPGPPAWALQPDDLPSPTASGGRR